MLTTLFFALIRERYVLLSPWRTFCYCNVTIHVDGCTTPNLYVQPVQGLEMLHCFPLYMTRFDFVY